MDRKNFIRSACGLGICSCFGSGLLPSGDLIASSLPAKDDDTTIPVVKVDPRQVQNVLSYVESSTEEPVKKSIFERLGYEHTTSTGFKNWINGYKSDLKSFFDRVNSNEDTYWEKMEYNPEQSSITITGRQVDRCACPFAQSENPPKSLCNYCCRNFQVQMFEMLLGKPVTVQIDEAFLLGNTRCSTTIFVQGKLDL